ncbi:hypothetical protein LGT36_012740 [Demequina sp. TMPB413]|nr:hypothetical protein [Demequina sp. TMPB413]UPU88097.1 hypothetical protein LGT36_012740 [Demequina sp. TMPB413]
MRATLAQLGGRTVGAGQAHGAQRLLAGECERPPGARILGDEEGGVEGAVVRGEHPPRQQLGEVPHDVLKPGRDAGIGRVDVVHVLGAQVSLGVDEGGPGVLAVSFSVEEDHAHLADAVRAVVREARGLQVDDGEASHGGPLPQLS